MGKDKFTSKERQQELLKGFTELVGTKEARKIRARSGRNKSLWFGLGMFGIVGWSVAVPTLIGTAIGIWIDTHYPSRFSWTLMLLFAGVLFGSINAWYWINRTGRNG
jgi:ATP synthase protein I